MFFKKGLGFFLFRFSFQFKTYLIYTYLLSMK